MNDEQRDSLIRLGTTLVVRNNHGWMFSRLESGIYVEVDHLRQGDVGAIVFRMNPDHMDTSGPEWVPVGVRPRFQPGETGWFIGGSKRFHANETLVLPDLGIEFAVGTVEQGGFHISKRNFMLRWQSDNAV